MKKSLFILMLCANLGACAGQAPAPQSAASLISFDEIAAEIQVTYESLETAPAEAAFAARGDTSVTPESP